MPWLRPVVLPRYLSATPQQSLNSGKDEPMSAKVIKIRTAAYSALHKSSDVERAGVILKFAELLMMFPEDTTVGQMLLQCANDEKKILTALHDVFARKATSTLITRSGSLAMFLAWHVATYPEEKIAPIEEDRLYEYCCACRDSGKSPSRISTLLGTLKYMGLALKLPGAAECAESLRVQGVSHTMFLLKRPRRRACMLTPSMLL